MDTVLSLISTASTTLEPVLAPLDEVMTTTDAMLQPYADAVALPVDQLKFLALVVSAYPLAVVHRFVPTAPLRHLYSTLLGIAFGVALIGGQVIHSFISSTVLYLLLAVSSARIVPTLSFIWILGYMSASHLYRQYTDYMGYHMDFTAPQMVLTLKLVAWAFNAHDGKRPKELRKDQVATAITKFPNPLEYYSYVYFYGGFLAGPFFEYNEYIAFQDQTMFTGKDGKYHVPSVVVPLLKHIALLGVVAYGGVLVGGAMFPEAYVATEEFRTTTTWLYRVGYIYIALLCTRCTYYVAWLLAEGSCMVSGFGFNGYTSTGTALWNRCSNVDVFKLEFAPNLKAIVDNWNSKTAYWLKRYIYLRITPPGQKPTMWSQLGTYGTSAIWHGFYPGYYLFFFSYAFISNGAAVMRKRIRPFFLKADMRTGNYPVKYVYDVVGWFAAAMTLNYLAITFRLLALDRGLNTWNSLYWYLHVTALVVVLLDKLGVFPRHARPDKKKKSQ